LLGQARQGRAQPPYSAFLCHTGDTIPSEFPESRRPSKTARAAPSLLQAFRVVPSTRPRSLQCKHTELQVGKPNQHSSPCVTGTQDRNAATASHHHICVRIDKVIALYVDLADLGVTREVARLFRGIESAVGTPYPVGSAVRDTPLGRESKDVDVELDSTS
jgi:hypothetical protein